MMMLLPGLAVQADGWRISAAEWAQPRDGAAMVRQAALAQAVKGFAKQPGSHIEVRYPGGDEGSLWARELQAWLVALGVPSRFTELVPGAKEPDAIELYLRAGENPGP